MTELVNVLMDSARMSPQVNAYCKDLIAQKIVVPTPALHHFVLNTIQAQGEIQVSKHQDSCFPIGCVAVAGMNLCCIMIDMLQCVQPYLNLQTFYWHTFTSMIFL